MRREGFDADALRGGLTRETTSHQSLPILCGGDDGDGGQHGEGGPEPPLRRQIHGDALGQEAARPLEEDQSREVFHCLCSTDVLLGACILRSSEPGQDWLDATEEALLVLLYGGYGFDADLFSF